MSTLGLPFLFFLWFFAGKGKGSPAATKPGPDMTTRPPGPRPQPESSKPAGPAPSKVPPAATSSNASKLAKYEPAAWPQVVPKSVPAFPGPGWVPDVPVGPGVPARAAQLLQTLWAGGEGSSRIEQTAGRWIAYRATYISGKKGVVAYKLLPVVPVSPDAPAVYRPSASSAPASVPASTTAPSSSQAPGVSTALPVLRRGMGSKAAPNADVRILQERLGVGADGIFGPGTEAAVVAYQNRHGLKPDGIVGNATWTALLGGSA